MHPDDLDAKEKIYKGEILELKQKMEELLAKDMEMKVELSKVSSTPSL